MINKMLDYAKSMLGTPWHHQGRVPNVGLDCAGLILMSLKDCGLIVNAPIDYARKVDPDVMLKVITDYCDAVEGGMIDGDLIFMTFRHVPQHVGLYIGNNRMIHCYEGHGVVIQELVPFWKNRIVGTYRLKDEFIGTE